MRDVDCVLRVAETLPDVQREDECTAQIWEVRLNFK